MPSRVEDKTIPPTRHSPPPTNPVVIATDQLISSARLQALSPLTRPLYRRRGTISTAVLPTIKLVTSSTDESLRPRSSPSSSQHIPPPLSGSVGASYFSPQPAASGTEPRSPANRRPPASRSSHGIETASGPPPALSTQRTQSFENAWRNPTPKELLPSYPKLTPRALATLDAVNDTQRGGFDLTVQPPQEEVRILPKRASSLAGEKGLERTIGESGAMIATITQTNPDHNFDQKDDLAQPSLESERTISLRSSGQSMKDMPLKNRHEGQQSESSQEDLFLNLAYSEDVANEAPVTTGWRERRQSLVDRTRHHHSTSRDKIAVPESQVQPERKDFSEIISPVITPRRSSLGRGDQSSQVTPLAPTERFMQHDRPYAASAHPLDQRHKPRLSGGPSRPTTVSNRGVQNWESPLELPTSSRRRPSVPESTLGIPSRAYRQTNISHAAVNGQYHSSPLNDRSFSSHQQGSSPPTPRAEGTESTLSTTAPSTLWDTVEDVKSRLKKLELIRSMPTSSGAAISNATGERPATATTTVTTISSSPKRSQSQNACTDSTANPDLASLHPNLHSALAKSKLTINASTFKALEATSLDALMMVKMINNAGNSSAVFGADNRHLKRRADSLCRSLTELCIALSEGGRDIETTKPNSRPGSRDAQPSRQQRQRSIEDSRFTRDTSQDSDLSQTSRVLSRLQARRTSTLGFNNSTTSSREQSAEASPSHLTATTTAAAAVSPRLRTATALQRVRRTVETDDADPTVRPYSRATTETGHRTGPFSQRQKGSVRDREYISQHPHPHQDPRSPSVQSSMPIRRSYFDQTPLPTTPAGGLPGVKRYPERLTPHSADSGRLAKARQQRLASLGVYAGAGAARQVAGQAVVGRRATRHSSLEPGA